MHGTTIEMYIYTECPRRNVPYLTIETANVECKNISDNTNNGGYYNHLGAWGGVVVKALRY